VKQKIDFYYESKLEKFETLQVENPPSLLLSFHLCQNCEGQDGGKALGNQY